MGHTEIDRQARGPQFVTVEDTVCAIHSSHSVVEPVAPQLLSKVAIISRLARKVLADKVNVDWAGFEANYDLIRDHISRTITDCENYNLKVRQDGGFVLPHPTRDERKFPTANGKAMLTVNQLESIEVPAGRLLLQTIRSHDQFNTPIYSLKDRYRGIHHCRRVVFINQEDLRELGIGDGILVDLHSAWTDGVDRVVRDFRVVSYPTARGCLFPGGERTGAAGQHRRGQQHPDFQGDHPAAGTGGRGAAAQGGLTPADRDACRAVRCMVRRMTSCIAPSCGRSDPALTR
ncbi:MAG: molybdopterin dinucleotide binding domain-containing protein [Nakamurella sp.]